MTIQIQLQRSPFVFVSTLSLSNGCLHNTGPSFSLVHERTPYSPADSAFPAKKMDTLQRLESSFMYVGNCRNSIVVPYSFLPHYLYRADNAVLFLNKYWHYSIYISVFYVVSIFTIQWWMKERRPYNLRRPLFIWSTGLAVFSIMGFYNCGPPHLRVLLTRGFKESVCNGLMFSGRQGLWMFFFALSKAPELLDTYFIVLRKQKLVFLHWYHHITVFVYTWFHYTKQIYPGQWYCVMNYAVHSVMYLYYAVRASGYYRPPVWVNMFITALQLLQMFLGIGVNAFLYYNMLADSSWHCDGRFESSYFYVYCSFAMYFSYLVLFAHFFYVTYIAKQSSKSIKLTGRDKPGHQSYATHNHQT